MNAPYCKALQERLLEEGVSSLRRDPDAEAHLSECDGCFAYLEALASVDGGLAVLPEQQPSEALVASTIAAVQALPKSVTPPRWAVRRRLSVAALPAQFRPYAFAATALLALFLVITKRFTDTDSKMWRERSAANEVSGRGGARFDDSYISGGSGGFAPEQQAAANSALAPQSPPMRAEATRQGAAKDQKELWQNDKRLAPKEEAAEITVADDFAAGAAAPAESTDDGVAMDAIEEESSYDAAPEPATAEAPPAKRKALEVYQPLARAEEGFLGMDADEEGKLASAVRGARKEDAPLVSKPEPLEKGEFRSRSDRRRSQQVMMEDQALMAEQPVSAPPTDQTLSQAEAYLKLLSQTEGLSFREPTGYWSNSYLPGDPELRSLHSSLATQDLSEVRKLLRHQSGLHLNAAQTTQPFDAPSDAAIAVFLQSDRTSVAGPSRMTLQVGLKGTVRGQGIRPAMNMGLVLDLTGVTDPRAVEAIWAVAYALNDLRDVGDKLSLAVVGCDAGQDLSPSQFKHGYLKVLAAQAAACNGRGGSRLDALRRISKQVTASDDPNAPLGSSALLLVTPSQTSPDVTLVEGFAHRSAVAGVPLSVIGVGEATSPDLERIALAGQGSRRLLRNAGEAKELVKRELAMVGGIVARAVRLRIRLAPGVKLVNILGSEQLDEARAQRVRDAEKSVDTRISRNLGIEADRGEDEEGIQIVIPVFMAGDAHVVLLDVVAPGPGPVADVTVRFKDLAFLKNGIARANLSLTNGADSREQRGALEQNVLKNRLAYETSQVLSRAASMIENGATADALRHLQTHKALLDSFALLYTGFARDADLLRDRELLGDYIEVLRRGVPTPWLPQSLEYSSKRKVLPLPRGE